MTLAQASSSLCVVCLWVVLDSDTVEDKRLMFSLLPAAG